MSGLEHVEYGRLIQKHRYPEENQRNANSMTLLQPLSMNSPVKHAILVILSGITLITAALDLGPKEHAYQLLKRLLALIVNLGMAGRVIVVS
jgi:hypothetical protein